MEAQTQETLRRAMERTSELLGAGTRKPDFV
jgi:hypothetical protein